MRLRRSDPGRPGWSRQRRGRGFRYVDGDGAAIDDVETLDRIRALAIPPAWRDVWICPDPRGHLQATGRDAASRRQYLYHAVWRAKRDAAKFDHVLDVAARLPDLRKQVSADLRGSGLCRNRVLATTTRLVDLGMFRIGNTGSAAADDPTYGLTTLRPEHVRASRGCVVLEFTGKGGVEHARTVDDPDACQVLRDLRRRRRTSERLFGWWDATGRCWHDVRGDEFNQYLRDAAGTDMSAKDFRTWRATVRAATRLADAGWHASATRRRRQVADVMRDVSELLGNTPAVARASYVDPRVVDLYHDDTVIPSGLSGPKAERAVLELLSS